MSVATEVDEFEALLTEHGEISMAVIDIDGFTRDIWDRSERLREAGIPVLVLTMSAPSVGIDDSDRPAVAFDALGEVSR